MTHDLRQKTYLSDGELCGHDLTLLNACEIESGGPWGQGFEEPMFHGKFLIKEKRFIKDTHLQMKVQPILGKLKLNAILFNIDPKDWQDSNCIDMVYKLKVNRFRDQQSLQLMVVNARVVLAKEAALV